MAVRLYTPKGKNKNATVSSTIEKELHDWLFDTCEKEGVTMSYFIRGLLHNARQEAK